MNINDLYPSKYIKSDDIGHQRITLQVAAIKLEEVAENEAAKPVMYFHGKEKGMVVNKTNAMLCGHVWGPDTDVWLNQWLELFTEAKMFNGKVVQGLSVAPKLPTAAPQPEAAPAAAAPQPTGGPGPEQDSLADDIPF